jgi:hypothetical protein
MRIRTRMRIRNPESMPQYIPVMTSSLAGNEGETYVGFDMRASSTGNKEHLSPAVNNEEERR